MDLIRFCDQCDRRFLIDTSVIEQETRCFACLNVNVGGGKVSGSSKNAALKRALKKKEALVLETTGRYGGFVLPLRDLCITTIINNMEKLDYITTFSPETKRQIARIISKHRKLDGFSLPLFLGPDEDTVELFDCTKLTEENLSEIAASCPNLSVLLLNLCGTCLIRCLLLGRMTDNNLSALGEHVPLLSSLTLHGPFLCTAGGFAGLFQQLSNLNVLNFEFAVKLSNESLGYLQEGCPQLRVLSLTDCPYINDQGIASISKMTNLTELSLNSLGKIADESINQVLSVLGHQLSVLSLNKHEFLTDLTLESITKHCVSLVELSLQHCPLITSGELTENSIELTL